MPRIYSAESDPIDFCKKCFPKEKNVEAKYMVGEGPDERGNCFAYNAEHPDYSDTDYVCEKCGKRLTDKDN